MRGVAQNAMWDLRVMVLFALTLIAGVAAWFVFLILAAHKDARIRRALYDKLMREHARDANGAVAYSVHCRTERHMRGLDLSFFVWESAGVLYVDTGSVRFFGEDLKSHRPIAFHFDAQDMDAQWIGRRIRWPKAGTLAYVKVSDGDKSYFFAVDTGMTILGSKKRTQGIFDELRLLIDKPYEVDHPAPALAPHHDP